MHLPLHVTVTRTRSARSECNSAACAATRRMYHLLAGLYGVYTGRLTSGAHSEACVQCPTCWTERERQVVDPCQGASALTAP